MKEINIQLVRGDDWMGLYLNGELVYQNHSIDVQHTLKALENHIDLDFKEYCINQDYLEDMGGLPAQLEEIDEMYLD